MTQHYTLEDLSICYRALLRAIGQPKFSEERHAHLKEYVSVWKGVEPAVRSEFMVFLRNYISITQHDPSTREKLITLANNAGPFPGEAYRKYKRL